jgi:hypothetical protein
MLRLEVSIIRVMNYTGTRVFKQDGVKARVVKIPVYTRVFKYPCILIPVLLILMYLNTRE